MTMWIGCLKIESETKKSRHPEERVCARLEGWPRVHASRPSFETLASQAPQDDVSAVGPPLRAPLFHPDVGGLDHRPPFGDLGLLPGAERFRRELVFRRHIEPEVAEFLLHGRI